MTEPMHLPLGGVQLMVVEDGTTVTDERTGESVIITKTQSAMKDGVLWCTQELADAIKKRLSK